MANICENTLYACGDPENIKAIEKFFDENYKSVVDFGYLENDSTEIYFDSIWIFPEEEMVKLYQSLPRKDDIYMRCLSVEYGCLYHALWVCDEEGWKEV